MIQLIFSSVTRSYFLVYNIPMMSTTKYHVPSLNKRVKKIPHREEGNKIWIMKYIFHHTRR